MMVLDEIFSGKYESITDNMNLRRGYCNEKKTFISVIDALFCNVIL